MLYLIFLSSSFVFYNIYNQTVLEDSIHSIDRSKPTLLLFGNFLETETEPLQKSFNLVSVYPSKIDTSYSFQDISKKGVKLIDSLHLKQVHVLGKEVGGLSAIHFSSVFKERVNTLTLISSNSVAELELLGGYFLNNAVYKVQYWFYLSVKYFIPHFGLNSNLDHRIEEAHILFDSDQRQINDLARGISAPTLIVATSDEITAMKGAQELARLIPQSNLISTRIDSLSRTVYEFISLSGEQVEYTVSVQRKVKSKLPFDDTNAINAEGKGLVVLMLVIIFSTLVSEDLTCIGTGLLIARGLVGYFPGLIACLVGIFLGDILLFLAGRWLASSTLHKAPFKWFITEKDIQKSFYWFKAKGPSIIIASRFIPGTRFPTYFSAGAIGANFWVFIFYFGIASIIWTPILVGLANLLGKEMLNYFTVYQEYALWVILVVVLGVFSFFKLIVPMFTYKGRRLLIGKFKRFLSWEFWPSYILYIPIFFYLFILWFKYKSVTVFALANPSIPNGGFIKESKKEILDGIKQRNSIANYIEVKSRLTYLEKLNLINCFQNDYNLHFPLVLKPDVGERGKGVLIPKNQKELESVLKRIDSDYICQEFIDGEEFGVFYYKYPTQEKGAIFSITKKVYLELVGDGVHTLEELILKDQRAVCLAELHLDKHFDRLFDIPKKGEQIKLVELGTHSRGAIFLDANYLITNDLRLEIERISSSYEGFYFGRFDIKVSSEDSLKKGINIKVIELNGVTSESTNIYDPNNSLFFAIYTLCKQWSIAYKIGCLVKAQNPSLKAPTIKHLLSLLH